MSEFTENENRAMPEGSADYTAPVLEFESFEGGGPEYFVEIEDRSVLSCVSSRHYSNPDHENLCGSGYTVKFEFEGLKPGKTVFKISARSPIADSFDALYSAEVDGELHVTVELIETKAPTGM